MPQSSLAASHLCAFRARASLDHHVVYLTHFLKLSLEYSTDQYIRCAICFLCSIAARVTCGQLCRQRCIQGACVPQQAQAQWVVSKVKDVGRMIVFHLSPTCS